MKFIKNTLIFGLFLAAPAGITLWIILGVISFFDQTFAPMVPFHFPGMGLLFAVLSLFIVGLIGSTFLGKLLKNSFDSLLEHVPLVRNIYKLFTQIGDAFFSKEAKSSFKKVVKVPFGSNLATGLGFWVRDTGEGRAIVFVPTSPNPTSGFILEVPHEHIQEVDMSVEDAFKVVLSCGALMDNKKSQSHN
ncbi:MAG: DUF502 domain-containing protein [bacterium]|jgi:uncharacterized membrane protein